HRGWRLCPGAGAGVGGVAAVTAPKMTATEVLGALYWHFRQRWQVLPEVTARPAPLREDLRRRYLAGERLPGEVWAAHTQRRIDALLVRSADKVSGGIERLAVEIKV